MDLTLVVLTNRAGEPPDLSTTELADLRRALELDFGPDLSGLGVYVGRKASPPGTDFAAKRLYKTAQGFSPGLCVARNPP